MGTSTFRRNRAQQRAADANANSNTNKSGGAADSSPGIPVPAGQEPAAGVGRPTRRKAKAARAALFPRIVVADLVADYRAIVPQLICHDDIVLEIGCCNGCALLTNRVSLPANVQL